MNPLLILCLLVLLNFQYCLSDNIELIDGTLIKDAKIMSVTYDSIMVFHSGGLEQFSLDRFNKEFLATQTIPEPPQEKEKTKKRKSLTDKTFSIYMTLGASAIGRVPKSTELETVEIQGKWKKVKIEVWVVDDVDPPKKNKKSLTPGSSSGKYDVHQLSVGVVSASIKYIRLNWSGVFNSRTRAFRILEMTPILLDNYSVPVKFGDVQELYVKGGERLSGSILVKRDVFEMCVFLTFEFRGSYGEVDLTEFVTIDDLGFRKR